MEIDALIIAGGKSTRMQSFKPLALFENKPLIHHVIERLSPQVNKIVINCNRPILEIKLQQVPDELVDYQGPLAGLHAGLNFLKSDWIQLAPCDTPFIPNNLVKKLSEKIIDTNQKIIVPKTKNQIHPTLSLVHKSIIKELNNFLKKNNRGFINFIESAGYDLITFDDDESFININQPEDIKKYEKSHT